MLRSAPKFYEIAKRVVEITEGCVIVAHNAQFDNRILKTEFKRLGFSFERESLCTVELSKQLIPDLPSYSLGKLVRSLGIPVSDRHRAAGDATSRRLPARETKKSTQPRTTSATSGMLAMRLGVEAKKKSKASDTAAWKPACALVLVTARSIALAFKRR